MRAHPEATRAGAFVAGTTGAALAEASRRRGDGELAAACLRECAARLAEITGEGTGEEVLDRIFATFCIGK